MNWKEAIDNNWKKKMKKLKNSNKKYLNRKRVGNWLKQNQKRKKKVNKEMKNN